VALIDVDPEYFESQQRYLAQAKKILDKHKLDWPNALAANGFNDMVRTFNISGYGNIVVDAKGIVRGVNLHGEDLERLLEEIVEVKKAAGSRSDFR
jgi:hypothetical protein